MLNNFQTDLQAAELTSIQTSVEIQCNLALVSAHCKTLQLSDHHNGLVTVVCCDLPSLTCPQIEAGAPETQARAGAI